VPPTRTTPSSSVTSGAGSVEIFSDMTGMLSRHSLSKELGKIASKTLEILKNACKWYECVSGVFLFSFKKLRRVSKRTEKAEGRF